MPKEWFGSEPEPAFTTKEKRRERGQLIDHKPLLSETGPPAREPERRRIHELREILLGSSDARNLAHLFNRRVFYSPSDELLWPTICQVLVEERDFKEKRGESIHAEELILNLLAVYSAGRLNPSALDVFFQEFCEGFE